MDLYGKKRHGCKKAGTFFYIWSKFSSFLATRKAAFITNFICAVFSLLLAYLCCNDLFMSDGIEEYCKQLSSAALTVMIFTFGFYNILVRISVKGGILTYQKVLHWMRTKFFVPQRELGFDSGILFDMIFMCFLALIINPLLLRFNCWFFVVANCFCIFSMSIFIFIFTVAALASHEFLKRKIEFVTKKNLDSIVSKLRGKDSISIELNEYLFKLKKQLDEIVKYDFQFAFEKILPLLFEFKSNLKDAKDADKRHLNALLIHSTFEIVNCDFEHCVDACGYFDDDGKETKVIYHLISKLDSVGDEYYHDKYIAFAMFLPLIPLINKYATVLSERYDDSNEKNIRKYFCLLHSKLCVIKFNQNANDHWEKFINSIKNVTGRNDSQSDEVKKGVCLVQLLKQCRLSWCDEGNWSDFRKDYEKIFAKEIGAVLLSDEKRAYKFDRFDTDETDKNDN